MILALLAAATPGLVPTPVLARPVDRGELLSPADFVEEDKPASAGVGALSPAAVKGMEATRRLMPGAVVRANDVMAPRMVRRGEPVTLKVRQGGLTITAQGRALSDGRRGDIVRVVATPTNRTLEGAVEGPGAVRIAAN